VSRESSSAPVVCYDASLELRLSERGDSDEIVTYRHKRRVQTALARRSVTHGSEHPQLN